MEDTIETTPVDDTCDCRHGPNAELSQEYEVPSPPVSSLAELATSDPSPLPVPRQPILLYSQRNHPYPGELPRGFYDPHTLFNEFPFTLQGNQEYIILIQDVGFENQDHFVYPAFIKIANGPLVIEPEQEPDSLCLLLRHTNPGVNLNVAAHTSLAFLMENARVSIRLCYISQVAEFCLRHDQKALVTQTQNLPDNNYLATYSPFEPTPEPLPEQVAARHPLLLRRKRTLPKLSPLAEPPAQ